MHGLASTSSLLPGQVGGLLTRQRSRSSSGMEQGGILRQGKAMKHKGGEAMKHKGGEAKAKAKEDANLKHDKEVPWFFLALLCLAYANVAMPRGDKNMPAVLVLVTNSCIRETGARECTRARTHHSLPRAYACALLIGCGGADDKTGSCGGGEPRS